MYCRVKQNQFSLLSEVFTVSQLRNTQVIDTSLAIHFKSLTHKITSITKHGATEIQGQVINLVEIEFAILMNSLPSRPNTNTQSFISFNNTALTLSESSE